MNRNDLDGPHPDRTPKTKRAGGLPDGCLEVLKYFHDLIPEAERWGPTKQWFYAARVAELPPGIRDSKALIICVGRGWVEEFQIGINEGPQLRLTTKGQGFLAELDASGHGEVCRRKLGRPFSSSPEKDKRIADAWNSGNWRLHAELGKEFQLSSKEIKAALDRHRKRTRG